MYKIISESIVLRVTDNTFIPVDEGNSDYVEYLKWVADGNTPVS